MTTHAKKTPNIQASWVQVGSHSIDVGLNLLSALITWYIIEKRLYL